MHYLENGHNTYTTTQHHATKGKEMRAQPETEQLLREVRRTWTWKFKCVYEKKMHWVGAPGISRPRPKSRLLNRP